MLGLSDSFFSERKFFEYEKMDDLVDRLVKNPDEDVKLENLDRAIFDDVREGKTWQVKHPGGLPKIGRAVTVAFRRLAFWFSQLKENNRANFVKAKVKIQQLFLEYIKFTPPNTIEKKLPKKNTSHTHENLMKEILAKQQKIVKQPAKNERAERKPKPAIQKIKITSVRENVPLTTVKELHDAWKNAKKLTAVKKIMHTTK